MAEKEIYMCFAEFFGGFSGIIPKYLKTQLDSALVSIISQGVKKLNATGLVVPCIIQGSEFVRRSYAGYMDQLKGLGASIILVEYAGCAIKMFESERFPLLIVCFANIRGGPGDDKGIQEVMDEEKARQTGHWRMGMYVVERAKSEGSLNKDTPILVLNPLPPDGELYNDKRSVLEMCTELGATYVSTDKTDHLEFIEIVRPLLGGAGEK